MPRYIVTEHEESQVYLIEFELSAFTLGDLYCFVFI